MTGSWSLDEDGTPIATALSGALLGTGITAGALAQGPAAASSPQASAGPAASIAIKSYAPVVRQVVPSVVLIRTPGGLGSGVILDGKGNIVTNAHVTGNVARFQIQLADDPVPRSARLVGSYGPDDLAVIRAEFGSPCGPGGRVSVGWVRGWICSSRSRETGDALASNLSAGYCAA